MFDELYTPYDTELAAFNRHWCGPYKYESWKETLVARYEKEEVGDGQTVEIYCTAAPARFYTIRALAGKNSVGEPQAAYELGTGSSGDKLAAAIGSAISQGMLALHASSGGGVAEQAGDGNAETRSRAASHTARLSAGGAA